MKEVYPGIFCIKQKGWFGIIKPSVNIYIITGKDGLVFDSGYGAGVDIKRFAKSYNKINRICRERGYENRINRILLSHAHVDHFSGLRGLRDRLGFKVIVTEEMRHIISSSKNYRDSYELPDLESKKSILSRFLKILKSIYREIEFYFYSFFWGIKYVEYSDIIIDSETEIAINDEIWSIFCSPGHSNEHITLYNRERGILFSGDNVLKSINVWLGPPKSDIDEYEDSLKKMIELPNLKIILPAHGNPIDNPYERLKEIIDWRRKRTEDVYEIVKSSSPKKLSVNDILNILYPNDKKLKKKFAEGWVELTLYKLENENKILSDGNRFFYNKEFQEI
ncbi:MAG: MBL fold metallo-hydrolase [Leptospirales bacterium]|nr:MBL fold metallo-hydrolase [Leptospirales bacterium]